VNRKRLLIVGAGDLGREVHVWFAGIDSAIRDWDIKGFLDSSSRCPKIADLNVPLLGSPERYEPEDDDVFVCAIGTVEARGRVCEMIEARGGRFVTLAHPAAFLAPDAAIGAGCIVFPSALIDTKCVVEDHVTLYYGSKIGHDAVVSRWSMVLPNAMVGSGSVLGRGVTMATNSFSMNGIHVGDFATVGANSVAVRDVPPRTTVFGVPGRPLRTRGISND